MNQTVDRQTLVPVASLSSIIASKRNFMLVTGVTLRAHLNEKSADR